MANANPFIVLNHPIKVSSRNVRDGIIKELKELYMNQEHKPLFVPTLIEHLKQMGSDKLDKYKHIMFILDEFNVCVEVITTGMSGEELTYTIPKGVESEPPDDLKRKKFLGLF
jgi:hypothetical protein